MWLVTFKAVGSGYFPLDMLRYCQCWPANQEDVWAIQVVAGRDCDVLRDERTVHLRLITRLASMADERLYRKRWRSFGWKVELTSKQKF